jgi:putative membrane protein
MDTVKKYGLTYLKGLAMGAADIVPGVSGGSIALIAGIYQELLDSINAFNFNNLLLLKSFRIKEFYLRVNGNFLLSLLTGIMTSIFTLSGVITYLMEEHPIPLWSFFSGLILISAFLILKEIKKCKKSKFNDQNIICILKVYFKPIFCVTPIYNMKFIIISIVLRSNKVIFID